MLELSKFYKTIMFSNIFANIPQIIMTPDYYDFDGPYNYFITQILSVTTIQFVFKISCSPAPTRQIYRYQFRWAAIDDQRIEVLNSFITDVTNIASKSFTFSHSNFNTLQSYVTYLSIGFTDYIQFSLDITSLTTNSVTVTYTSSNAKMTQIGFQVVKYSVSSNTVFDSISHKQVWINAPNTKILSPYILKKLRMSRLQDYLSSTKPTLSITLVQLNVIFTTPNTQDILIDKTQQLLNVIVSFQCAVGTKVYGQLLRCTSCTGQYFTINQNCYSGINVISLYIQLYQQEQVYQMLSLIVTSSGMLIRQTIFNRAQESYNVVQLNIGNI